MKRILLRLLLATFYHSYGQDKNLFVYGSGGLGIGQTHMGTASINCVYKKNDFSIFYYNCRSRAKNVPSDYQQGWKFIDLNVGYDGPVNNMDLIGIMYGRVIPISKPIHLILKVGLFDCFYTYPAKFIRSGNLVPAIFSFVYYDVQYKKINTYACAFNPVVEFTLPVAGISTGPYLAINGEEDFYGWSVNLLLGYLRKFNHHD